VCIVRTHCATWIFLPEVARARSHTTLFVYVPASGNSASAAGSTRSHWMRINAYIVYKSERRSDQHCKFERSSRRARTLPRSNHAEVAESGLIHVSSLFCECGF
jgi:hypothetical protein